MSIGPYARRALTLSKLLGGIMVSTRRSTRAVSTTAVVANSQAGPSRPNKKLKVEPSFTEEKFPEESETQRLLDDESTQAVTSKPRVPKTKRSLKGKEVNRSDFLPRATRLWKAGAHVSAAGGVENAVINAAAIGANAFALFLKSQRKWESPPLQETSRKLFKERMSEYGYDAKHVLPHGSYLINLGNPDSAKRQKSYDCFIDDLKRCEALGLKYYNFHPGSTVGAATTEESINLISQCLNDAHKETEGIVTVIENMAGAGNIIGSTFADIKGIIDGVEDKTRVGVCFDTCHGHSAGYDISTKAGWESTMQKFEDEIGLEYLCGMHLNDSKTACGSKKDRHENMGMGTIGLTGFHAIMTDPRTQDIPLILETPSFEKPHDVWGTEIRILNELSTMPFPDQSIASDVEKHEKRLEEMAEEVRCAVGQFSDAKEKKAKSRKVESKSTKGKGKVAAAKGGKRKRNENESEGESEGGDDDDYA